MVKTIIDFNEIQDKDFVLLIKRGMRAPCRKLINECTQADASLNITFYVLDYNKSLEEFIYVSTLPSLIMFKDSVNVGKLEGWFSSQAQIVEFVRSYNVIGKKEEV